MGTIHALQRRVEVAQQGLTMFEEEARGTGARLGDAFGRIEEVLRDKDFQLVRRELEVQRLTRENAQARMLLETLLETVEQHKAPSLRAIIEEFERKLAASAALHPARAPLAEGDSADGPSAAGAEAEAAPEPEPESELEEPAESASAAEPEPAAPAAPPVPPPPPIAAAVAAAATFSAFADPAADSPVTLAPLAPAPVSQALTTLERTRFEEPEAEIIPPGALSAAERAADPNDELIADARANLRQRRGGARLMEEEQRRYAYKVWLGPILLGVGALGPLALVLARISH